MTTETIDQPRQAANVITSENLAEFTSKRLGLSDIAPAAEQKEADPEPKNAESGAKTDPEGDKKADSEGEQKPEGQKKPKNGFSERITEVIAQRKAAEERAAAAEARAAELEAKLAPKPAADAKPDPATYTDHFKYAEDLANWSAKNALSERDRADREQREADRQAEMRTQWNAKQEKARAAHEDHDDVIAQSTIMVPNHVRDAIIESDSGPELLYYLAQNPEHAERIGKMTPARAGIELGKIEAKLEAPAAAAPKAEAKAAAEVSRAPEPITPLKGGNGAVEVPINSKGEFTGTFAQFKQLRQQGKIH